MERTDSGERTPPRRRKHRPQPVTTEKQEPAPPAIKPPPVTVKTASEEDHHEEKPETARTQTKKAIIEKFLKSDYTATKLQKARDEYEKYAEKFNTNSGKGINKYIKILPFSPVSELVEIWSEVTNANDAWFRKTRFDKILAKEMRENKITDKQFKFLFNRHFKEF